jgi:hypothetical protein
MRVSRTGAVVLALALGAPLLARAQDQDRGRWNDVARLDPGTTITVRTNEPIDSSRTDYRVYTATVDRGIRADNGDLAIPRGATAELIVRSARDNDLILDLESVTINGHRYAVRTNRQRVDSGNNGYNDNNLIGQIVGAINGDHGRYVRLQPGTQLGFRLDQPLDVDVSDLGVTRDGHHYHDWYRHGTN